MIRSDSPHPRRAKPLAISVTVPTDDRGYSVLVGQGVLERVGAELHRLHPNCHRVALVSDANVMPLYGDRVEKVLVESSLEVRRFEIPAGEAQKNPQRLVELVEGFAAAGLGRHDAVVALGGGVIGDLAGFAAASYMRGVAFVQVPTSLLAQVDASVGGKVAVDLASGKNLLGAFHFPSVVCIDPRVLQTLDARQVGCGLAEMLKHAALFAPDQFEQLITVADDVYGFKLETLATAVAKSVALKAACVSRDPLEHGAAGKGRVVLNLGHTVGHAIEHVSDYEVLHGEAVALGMVAAARISERKGLCEPGLERRITDALVELRLPTDLEPWLRDDRVDGMERAMAMDKKRGHARVSYIALRRIGEPAVLQMTGQEILALLRS